MLNRKSSRSQFVCFLLGYLASTAIASSVGAGDAVVNLKIDVRTIEEVTSGDRWVIFWRGNPGRDQLYVHDLGTETTQLISDQPSSVLRNTIDLKRSGHRLVFNLKEGSNAFYSVPDLNDDGDVSDIVPQVYDLEAGELRSTRLGVHHVFPYRNTTYDDFPGTT